MKTLFKMNKKDQVYRKILNVVGNKKHADKTIKSRGGKLLIDNARIINRWIEYIENLYDGENLENWEVQEEPITMNILKFEFDLALNKAPGINYIPTELL